MSDYYMAEAIKTLKQISRELKLIRQSVQRLAPEPNRIDVPDLETYCEQFEEDENEVQDDRD